VIHPREEPVTSFQRWVALPPGVEDGPSEAIYVPPAQVPQVGSVCVLLGEYGGQRNPITAPSSIAYLDVTLDAGQAWTWAPPPGHDVAWAFPYRGRVRAGGEAIAGELVVLEEGAAPISLEVDEPFRVLSGSAAKQPHRLVLGDYSVHTSRKVLARGEPRIRAVREELRQRGLV
jgi:redox-sensitive bicupin YhaK (pirin superfamily)